MQQTTVSHQLPNLIFYEKSFEKNFAKHFKVKILNCYLKFLYNDNDNLIIEEIEKYQM